MGMEWDVILSLIFLRLLREQLMLLLVAADSSRFRIMSTFPNMSTATVIGTNKVSSILVRHRQLIHLLKSKVAMEAFSRYCHLCFD